MQGTLLIFYYGHKVDITNPNSAKVMWQQWVNAVLGLWVIAVPFLSLTGATLMWTLAITGIAIAVLAVWGASQEQSERTARYQT